MLTRFTLRTHTSRGSLILLNNYYTIPETMNTLILLINFSSPFNSLLKDSVPPLLQPHSQLIIFLLPDLLRKLKQFPTFRSTLTLLPIFLAVTRWTVLLLKSILHCKLNSLSSCLLDDIISAILISFKNHEFFTTSFPVSNQHAAFLRLTNSTQIISSKTATVSASFHSKASELHPCYPYFLSSHSLLHIFQLGFHIKHAKESAQSSHQESLHC